MFYELDAPLCVAIIIFMPSLYSWVEWVISWGSRDVFCVHMLRTGFFRVRVRVRVMDRVGVRARFIGTPSELKD